MNSYIIFCEMLMKKQEFTIKIGINDSLVIFDITPISYHYGIIL